MAEGGSLQMGTSTTQLTRPLPASASASSPANVRATECGVPLSGSHALMIDNQHLYRAGLRELLARDLGISDVSEASTHQSAVGSLLAQRTELVTVEATPGMSLPAATRSILRASPWSRVVVITRHEDRVLERQTYSAGASGFAPKSTPPANMAVAIRAALLSARQAPVRERALLSTREMEVLLLMQDARSNRAIARELFIAEGTVKRHVGAILSKLDAHSRMEAIRKAALLDLLS